MIRTDEVGARVAERDVVSDRVWTVPNVISFVRLLMVPVFAVLIAQGHDGWALLVLAGSGASDWLDGVLARRLGQVSRLGQVLDPAADRLFILVTLLGLAARDVVPWWLVVVLLAREAMLLVMLMALARHGYGPLHVHLAGKAGTFALLYAFPLLLLAHWGGLVGDLASVLGWAFAWWGVALYWFAGMLYVRQAWVLLARQGDTDTGEPRPVAA
ncbi:CDP-alcohol phosphatidyltransferase family protein [Cellulomonas triticagri]|uniref:CDP-alcohol phosphatidyltransferase family protein n=1 Tax=Cellulomonas triticagri TaxID=2483352 RepID=UPI001F25EBA7|nr:CDP-alcohol phosphatidyltransferase family protein [Cellulomonas triticagri]